MPKNALNDTGCTVGALIGVTGALLIAIGVAFACCGFIPVGVPIAVVGGILFVGVILKVTCK